MSGGGRKKGHGGGGGHGGSWVVTFADLVSLLMAFFVMIVSFSVPNTEAVNRVAGSFRDAFGVQPDPRIAGIIERDGLPMRDTARSVGLVDVTEDVEFETLPEDTRPQPGDEANTHDFEQAASERPHQFLSAAETLRQAMADLPEIAEISRAVQFEETEKGLHIRIVDQDGRPMFVENSATAVPTLARLLERLAPALQQMPNRVRISGHTSAGADDGLAAWRLSLDRAVEASRILAAAGLGSDHFEAMEGLGDRRPLYARDPYLSANRRIELLLIREAPPLPLDLVQ